MSDFCLKDKLENFTERAEVELIQIHYVELLKKYIQYVKDCEGTDFLDHCEARYCSIVEFTDSEWNELVGFSEAEYCENEEFSRVDTKVE